MIKGISKEDRKKIEELKDRHFPKEKLLNISRLGGLTNHTYAVTMDFGKYIFRVPGEGTEKLINRENEKISNELACDLGIDSSIVYFNTKTGIKICHYIDDAETMSPEKMKMEENLIAAIAVYRILHNSNVDTKVPFDVFEMVKSYELFIKENKVSLFTNYSGIRKKVFEIKQEIDEYNVRLVPCHNDPLCENWVKGKDRMYLIDWEYAGMNDPLWDLADLSIETGFNREVDEYMLKIYDASIESEECHKRFIANKIFLDFLWSLWGKTRVPYDGEEMEKYAQERFARLVENLKYWEEI